MTYLFFARNRTEGGKGTAGQLAIWGERTEDRSRAYERAMEFEPMALEFAIGLGSSPILGRFSLGLRTEALVGSAVRTVFLGPGWSAQRTLRGPCEREPL